MSEKLKIGPYKAAVLIMDCQTDIIGILGTKVQHTGGLFRLHGCDLLG